MGDFFKNIDYFMLLKAFVVGGILCIIAQILIDKTKLTPARIVGSRLWVTLVRTQKP